MRGNDEATWWNLAIAATALSDWAEARRGWIECGITPNGTEGEVTTGSGWACVRLNPDGKAEVVWGDRIDPARIVVRNVPLPESDRRYGDIILNDVAQEGTRTSNGEEFPVFNELMLWKRSSYSTFAVEVNGATDEADESLGRICTESDVWAEDWGSVRMLCRECSLGNPGEHGCGHDGEQRSFSRFGFAARTEGAVREVLRKWLEIEPEVSATAVSLAVLGVGQ